MKDVKAVESSLAAENLRPASGGFTSGGSRGALRRLLESSVLDEIKKSGFFGESKESKNHLDARPY
jgi:hypothetical protein